MIYNHNYSEEELQLEKQPDRTMRMMMGRREGGIYTSHITQANKLGPEGYFSPTYTIVKHGSITTTVHFTDLYNDYIDSTLASNNGKFMGFCKKIKLSLRMTQGNIGRLNRVNKNTCNP